MAEKTMQNRVKECVTLWRKLTVQLAIPATFDGMGYIKERIDEYIKTGEAWSGEVEIPSIGRVAKVNLPLLAKHDVTITLSVIKET